MPTLTTGRSLFSSLRLDLFAGVLLTVAAGLAQPVSFGPASTFAAGADPISAAVGDFNSDGKPDLVVANFGSNNVSVFLGTGTGGFGPVTNFAAGQQPFSVRVADLNGDGKVDLAVANSGSVSILLGNGNGTFGPASNVSVGTAGRSIAIGDLNGDGKLDMVVANNASNSVSVLMGLGTGAFGLPADFATGSGTAPGSIVIEDFNGDSKPDLAVAKFFGGSVAVLLGNGNGTFGPAANFPTDLNNSQAVAVGDFNADGKPDLAVANSGSNTVSVLLGLGTGSFAAATNLNTGASSGPSSVTIGDFNGDAKLDIATANAYSNTVSVFPGAGDGTFGTMTSISSGGTNPRDIGNGDLNGDGKTDLAVVNYLTTNLAILLNTSTFPAPTTPAGRTAYWPADGAAVDVIGGLQGTLFSGASYSSGILGQGFRLDGVDDYVLLPHGSGFSFNGDYTFSFWIRPDVVPLGARRIFLSKRLNDDYAAPLVVWTTSNPQIRFSGPLAHYPRTTTHWSCTWARGLHSLVSL